eukprot:3823852-Rhodomonas_salina.1
MHVARLRLAPVVCSGVESRLAHCGALAGIEKREEGSKRKQERENNHDAMIVSHQVFTADLQRKGWQGHWHGTESPEGAASRVQGVT